MNVRTFSDGRYLVTIAWATATQQFQTRFLLPQASPPSSPEGTIGLLVDPSPPASAALADPSLSENSAYRVDAAFQSTIPFTMAVLVMALFVIWPQGPPEVFAPESIRRARRGVLRYAMTTVVVSTLAVLVPVVIQAQPILAYSPDAVGVGGVFSAIFIGLFIWLCVRAGVFYRYRRMLTAINDATDPGAVISCVAGRRLWIDTKRGAMSDQNLDGETACVQMVAMRGQHPAAFAVGDRVRLYASWLTFGPTVVADTDRVLAGRGQRRDRLVGPVTLPATDDVGGLLVRRFPRVRRSLWRYLLSTIVIALAETAGSVALAATVFGNVNGTGGDTLGWLVSVVFTWGTAWWIATLYRWRGFARLVRGPYVTHRGMVVHVRRSAIRSTFGATAATVETPGEAAIRIRCLGGQRLSWLSAGQDVVLMEQAPGKRRPALLSAPSGRTALVIARHTKADTSQAEPDASEDRVTVPLLRQYPRLAWSVRLYGLYWIAVLVVVGGGSIALTAVGLDPRWLVVPGIVLWPLCFLVPAKYSELWRLLRRSYTTHHGVISASTSSGLLKALRITTVTIEVPDEPHVLARTLAWQTATRLTDGNEVVIMRRTGTEISANSTPAAILASPDGHTALVVLSRAATVPTSSTSR